MSKKKHSDHSLIAVELEGPPPKKRTLIEEERLKEPAPFPPQKNLDRQRYCSSGDNNP